MNRIQRHHQPLESTQQVSRRDRGFVPRMGFASDAPTCGLTIVTQAQSGHRSRIDSEKVFKSPTPMGSESTFETSSPSPRTRKSNSSGAGTGGEGESRASSTRERGHRISISRDSDMCSSESTSDTQPSFPGDNHNDEETWTWFDSPARNGRTRDQKRKISFKIIVVFRGGWCDTSRTLLKGKKGRAAWGSSFSDIDQKTVCLSALFSLD